MINSIIRPFIKPPFPPPIGPKDLITKSIAGKKPSRAPNAFIIYRKMYVRESRNEGYCFPMTVLSSMVSQSWEKEPEEVKDYYKRLAKATFDYRNELYPKSENKKKKRSNWNVISFEKVLNQNNDNEKFTPVTTHFDNISTPNNDNHHQIDELNFINQILTPDLSSTAATSPTIDEINDQPVLDPNQNFNEFYNQPYIDTNQPYPNLLTSSDDNWNFNSYTDDCGQQLFENFQQGFDSCDFFVNQIIDNQIQNFNDFPNQQPNRFQVYPDNSTTSSDALGIFQHQDEPASNLQPFHSSTNVMNDINTISDNAFATFMFEPFDYHTFY
ncbi:7080_t:CDS:1 [Funneliformis geosporum]|uniref:13307_t:CDS:1 n=1 Tax=Funneliformis geosporum TaxID=1117311 RepID=A0A9W4WLH2_9GLOM|nr:7080_t:CDS:1 [Funneliformis geosporum]CAI2162788.1 13307_t:CDS:1 [Funneliformis geosporum]